MAQDFILGLTGSVELPGLAGQKIFNVQLDRSKALLPANVYGDNGEAGFLAALKNFAGSASALMTKGAAGTNPFEGTEGTVTITFDTGCSISATCVIAGASIVGEYAGMNVITFNFAKKAGTAAPTIQWNTAS